MLTCEVLIVGGGPAGSSCAWALNREGIDSLVVDRSTFPRDKVCAGWITPAVVEALKIDLEEYRRSRTCQPITTFRVGRIGGRSVEVEYGRPVSFGIRRCELDHYLLQRCGARLDLGTAVRTIRRTGGTWNVDDRFCAPMLVAAAGHFCPIARESGALDEHRDRAVVAQETEFPLEIRQQAVCQVRPDTPEIYFCNDLMGYGWCFRKDGFLNIGLGREDRDQLSAHVAHFCEWLKECRRIPGDVPLKWCGHAYYLHSHSPRKLVDEGMLAIGDAAGLAYAESGEGIRPAVESGLMAAGIIAAAKGDYCRERLRAYEEQIIFRFGQRNPPGHGYRLVPAAIRQSLGARLLTSRSFVRHVVLDRWFLRTHQSRHLQNEPTPPASLDGRPRDRSS